jgi:hypothetical protein
MAVYVNVNLRLQYFKEATCFELLLALEIGPRHLGGSDLRHTVLGSCRC